MCAFAKIHYFINERFTVCSSVTQGTNTIDVRGSTPQSKALTLPAAKSVSVCVFQCVTVVKREKKSQNNKMYNKIIIRFTKI